MRSYEERIRNTNRWAICMYDGKDNAGSRSQHLEGDRNDGRNTPSTPPYNVCLINVLTYLLKVLFSFCFCAIDLFIDFVTNRWLWSVLYVVVNVALDIFFHLVLALAAVMVVLILNIDDLYQQTKDENLKDVEAISDYENVFGMLRTAHNNFEYDQYPEHPE
ncbi:hypothetical protein Trydic_g11560 [Trypoxylus dichotomus]